MKFGKIFLIILPVIPLAWTGCNEKYEWVAPPVVDSSDDLDQEEAENSGSKDEQYIMVTVNGAGLCDGSSWENAMDMYEFSNALENGYQVRGKVACLAAGEYRLANAGEGISISEDVTIRGGYDPESKGTEAGDPDPSRFETVISGDLNGNGIADNGDSRLFNILGGKVAIENCILCYSYGKEDLSFGSGIYVTGNTELTIRDCSIHDCISRILFSSNENTGGALNIAGGTVLLDNVHIYNCEATSRGSAIAVNNGATVFMNSCRLHDNILTGQDDILWGASINVRELGCLAMNNCTVYGKENKENKISCTVNADGHVLVANSTIIGSSSDNYGVLRNGKSGEVDYLTVNSIIKAADDKNAFDGTINSAGWNIYYGNSGWPQKTETDIEINVLPGIPDNNGPYKWDWSGLGFHTTKSEVLNAVRGFIYGSDFISSIGDESFGVDGYGNIRNSSEFLPGSYDPAE